VGDESPLPDPLAMPNDPLISALVDRIRRGDAGAWRECIERFEGRLQAFVASRLKDTQVAEDLVQETFLGFLTALPNYDDRTPLENFLFSIAAHKLTDQLRRQGRRPTLSLTAPDSSHASMEPAASTRGASSLMRSQERREREAAVVATALGELIARWKARGEWERLKCVELLFVRGWPNREVAQRLGIGEQTVANYKHQVVVKLRQAAAAARWNADELDEFLSLPPD